jgi:hypothetical protein
MALGFILASERMVGAGGAFTDTLNRALRDLLTQSGYNPDATKFPGLAGPVFNVRAHGAKGDGVTDDSTAITDALAAATAAGGGIVYVPPAQPNQFYPHATPLVVSAGVRVVGSGFAASLRYTGTSGVAVTLGTSDTVLSSRPALEHLVISLAQPATTAVRLRGTVNASLLDLYIEGRYYSMTEQPVDATRAALFAARTNIGLDIDAVSISTFLNSARDVTIGHIHTGVIVRSTGTNYATVQDLRNVAVTGDALIPKTGGGTLAGDTTGTAYKFVRSPVVTAGVGNGEGTTISGGNVENITTGFDIEAGPVQIDGVRFEPNVTTQIKFGANAANCVVRACVNLSRALITDLSPSGSNNVVFIPAEENQAYTPALTTTTGGVTVAPAISRVTVSRSGNDVHMFGWMRLSAVSTPTGTLSMSLPYATRSHTDGHNRALGTAVVSGAIAGMLSPVTILASGGASTGALYAGEDLADIAVKMQANVDIYVDFRYKTA